GPPALQDVAGALALPGFAPAFLSAHTRAWYQGLLAMDAGVGRPSASSPDVPLLIALYGFEISALLVVLALHARVFTRALVSLDTALFSVWCLGLVASAAIVVRRWRRQDRQRVLLTAALNLVPVLLLLVGGEVAVRALSRPTARGPVFMET